MQSAIEAKDSEIDELRKEVSELKSLSSIKYEAAVKESSIAHESIKSSKKLCELYAAENDSVQSKVSQMDKEMSMLRSEIQFLESENQRLGTDNV